MRIDALTTCVGEKYAAYLKKSLPIWVNTCDMVHIVTTPTDCTLDMLDKFGSLKNVAVHLTNVFTAYGASFNKGAALSYGFACMPAVQLTAGIEWILNFDADVLPPPDWRKKVEPLLRPGKLFGCSHRYREDGSQIPDADFPNIWGFFHLWHVSDPHSWRRPVYESTCGHAGNYDHTFMMQWPEKERVDLWPEIKVIHQGEPRQSWFGNDPQNSRKMKNLFTLGLYEAWQTRAGHIKVPPPEKVVTVSRLAPDWHIAAVLEKYTDPDPFRYKVEIE